MKFRESGGEFSKVQAFQPTQLTDEQALRFAPKAQFLTLDLASSASVALRKPQAITVYLDFQGQTIPVDLVLSNLHTEDFSVVTSLSGGQPVVYDEGAHYRGMIQSEPNSLASFSFFTDGEVMASVSGGGLKGNLVLGKLDLPGNTDRYILYDDQEVKAHSPAVCHTPEKEDLDVKIGNVNNSEVNGCVRMYLEADYELFQNKTTVQATVNYLSGAYNQVATLYNNEAVSTTLSQVFVWLSDDAYSTTNASTVLDQFRLGRASFNGNVAHLTGTGGNNLGGIGYIDVLCFNGYNYSYSDINTSYSNVPTYSWTVEVMAHEIGHNLGSNHTHWCGWTGGALDNCYTTEGGCAAGPAPVNGGTVMSYCHLAASGINFSNGFGTQPGDLIRSRVSTSSCLAATCTVNTCNAPVAFTVSNIGTTGATISWTAVTGATSYTLRYRKIGASTWTTVTGATSPVNISGLLASSSYEVTVRSECGTAVSDYVNGVLFKTTLDAIQGGNPCDAPSSLTISAISSSAATVSWPAVTGALNYSLSYKTNAATTWSSPVAITGTSTTLSGLASSTLYNVQVSTNCESTASASTAGAFTTAAAAVSCGTPTNLAASSITTSSALISWTAVSGASSYEFSFKLGSASTWSSPVTITGTSTSISGLTASTAYNVQIRANCSGTYSSYATVNFTTTAAATCNAPTNLAAGSITSSGATITWTAASGASSYSLQYKKSTTTTWSTAVTVSGTSYNLTGLTAATLYNVQVKTVCTSGSSGFVSANFTTSAAATCAVPAVPTVGSITSTGALVSWPAASGAVSYTLQYRKGNGSWLTVSNIAATSYTLTGLSKNSSYSVKVRSNCSGGATSAYSSVKSFKTLAAMPPGGGNGPNTGGQPSNDPVENATEEEVEIPTFDVPAEENVWIAPNPATSYVTVALRFDTEVNADVEMLDLLGRPVKSETIRLQEGSVSFPVADMNSGVYLIRVTENGKLNTVRRFIKN